MVDPYAEGEEDDWPSDHHPETDQIKSTPSDWYRRDQNQRWVKSSRKDEPHHQRAYTNHANPDAGFSDGDGDGGGTTARRKRSGVDSALAQSVSDEDKAQQDYSDYAEDADRAGRPEVADRFREVRRDETQHEKEFRALQGRKRRGRRSV